MRLLPAIALAALALAGCGSDDATRPARRCRRPRHRDGDAAVTTETETDDRAETAPGARCACSTSGLRLTLPEQDLPAAVADVRKRVFDAAVACDYDTLEEIALEKGAGFTFSYGSGEDASEYWRERRGGLVRAAEADAGAGDDPDAAVHAQRVAARTPGRPPTTRVPTEDDWQALVDAGLYDAEVIDQMKTQGTGYLGYRTAITPDGDWQFFVAGD